MIYLLDKAQILSVPEVIVGDVSGGVGALTLLIAIWSASEVM